MQSLNGSRKSEDYEKHLRKGSKRQLQTCPIRNWNLDQKDLKQCINNSIEKISYNEHKIIILRSFLRT